MLGDVLRVVVVVDVAAAEQQLGQKESAGTVFQIRFLRASALVVVVRARAPGAVEGAAVASRGFGSPRIKGDGPSRVVRLPSYAYIPSLLGDVALEMPMGANDFLCAIGARIPSQCLGVAVPRFAPLRDIGCGGVVGTRWSSTKDA